MKINKIAFCYFICEFLFFVFLGLTAFASSERDPYRECSFSVMISENGKGIPNVGFSVYQIASLDSNDQYKAAEQFLSDSEIINSFNNPTGGAWSDYIDHFNGRCALSEKFAFLKTDQNGTAVFDMAHLSKSIPQGIYFIIPSSFSKSGYKYILNSFFFCIPQQDSDGNWSYTGKADLSEKFLKYPESSSGDTGSSGHSYAGLSLKAVKLWNDKGYEKHRPQEILVTLFGDGKAYEKVSLTEANNWSAVWNGLDSSVHWTVAENVIPDGYESVLTREGNVFVLTNTYADSRETVTGNVSDSFRKLPQTGLLWWIVPVLSACGVLLFSIGWLLYRKGSKCKKQDL